MTSHKSNSVEQIYPDGDPQAQAAYWFAILQNEGASDAQAKAFSLWLSQDDAHKEAFDTIAAVFDAAARLGDDVDILALRREALGLGLSKPKTLKAYVITAVAAVFLAAFALTVSNSSFVSPFDDAVDKIATAELSNPNNLLLATVVGEQLTRTLTDGSLIELNTDSEVRVQLTDTQRSVYLLRGQAMFSVAHDAARPFIVYAGDRRVTALGTMFEVRLDADNAQVTLLEGKVKVDEVIITDKARVKPMPKVVELLPGERYVSATDEHIQIAPTKIQSELSWRDGRHIFVDEKISVIVSELNRYTDRKIIIGDSQIGDLKASANFKMGSTRSLSAALEATFDLSVRHNTSANTITIDWKN